MVVKDVPARCQFASEVVADILPWPSSDGDEGLQRKMRKAMSTSTRFAREWPTCHVTGKQLDMQFRTGASYTAYVGFFRCYHCQ